MTELPLNWAAFVDAIALGEEPEAAARALGYAEPKRTATLLMRHTTVRKALVSATQARLEGEAGPLAVKAVLEILGDEKAPAAVKAKLALGVLDRIQPAKEERGGGGKSLAEMTESELQDVVARLRASSPPADEMRDVTPG